MSQQVLDIMTPKAVLQRTEFEKPLIISPLNVPTFRDLLSLKEMIRMLEVVPVKDDQMYQHYKTVDKEVLYVELMENFKDDVHVFTQENKFPYWLPSDTQQRLVWASPVATDQQVAVHIADLLESENRKPAEVIIFERPIGIQSLLVRGTFPKIRHLHLWTRK